MKLSILAYIIKKVQQGLGIVQDTDTATQAISSGKYVFWKNKFKKASTNIAENDTLSMSNLVDVNGGALNEITEHIAHVRPVPSYSEQTIFASTDYTSNINASGTLQHTGSLYYHFWARKGRVSLSINGAESALLENNISATDSISIGGTIAVKEGDTFVLSGVQAAVGGTEYANVFLRY